GRSGGGCGQPVGAYGKNVQPVIGLLLEGAGLPVAVDPFPVCVIALVAMDLARRSTLSPSWRAAATQPAEALRYE
ncbi:lipoprotein-releasing system transmembrane subunit LolC, partial [Escherichia coli]|nr:lipoprotein-releasing system transmembrane subunit LolC [Escherichia coli]